MRINKIKLDFNQTSKVGLQEINLSRLETVVALVGKNGSGKSRVLNFIEANISSIVSLKNILKGEITHLPYNIKQGLKKLEPYTELALKTFEIAEITQLLKANPNDAGLKTKRMQLNLELAQIEQNLKPNALVTTATINRPNLGNIHRPQPQQQSPSEKMRLAFDEIQPLISKLHSDYIKRIDYSQIRQLQEVVTDNDEEVNSFEQLVESVTEQLVYNELGSIYKSSLRFLKKLPHQLVSDWMDCLGNVERFNKRKSYERFIALKEIFENIFGKNLEWEIKNVDRNVTDHGVESLQVGIWKINKREFNYSEFSDGEKTLFAYVLMFFLMSQNKSIRLKDSILIIDEPELHLHPDAEIDLITGIRNIIDENGQLYIATHSLNILSHLNYEEVFMVKDGLIKHPSNTIQREALAELMKIEERVLKLTEFLNSISEWAYVQFMIECFTNPDVIEVAKENDPQIQSLKDIINANEDNKKSLLLDFGAGKGRLYEQAARDERFMKVVDYTALEPNTDLHVDLKSKGISKIFSSYNELTEKSFDFIVLCNVLHEIDVNEWISTLNRIIETLNDDGSLIIIEAKNLRKGEQIGSTGFLLLDESELKILFGLDNKPAQLKYKEKHENISCILLPKNILRPVTMDDLILTMKALEENTLNKIYQLRTSADNATLSNKIGRVSAFLSQLHINSKLAQKELNGQLHESTNR